MAKATLSRIMTSQLCTQIILNFYTPVARQKFYELFYGVVHSGPIFYVVRLYVMTKTNGGCLKEWLLAPFAVMSQNFI